MKRVASRMFLLLGPLLCTVAGLASAAEPEQRIGTVGFFHLATHDGVWWFVTPEGQRFVTLGINHVEPTLLLADADRERSLATYGRDLMLPDGRANPRGQAARKFLEESLELIRAWGFNTLGMHSPIPQSELPYVAKFKPARIDGFTLLGRRYPDPFDPDTVAMVEAKAASWAETRRNDKLIIGIAFTDMPIWNIRPRRIHEWVLTLMGQEADSPGKRAWISRLQERYPTAAAAAATYGVEATDWSDLAHRTSWPTVTDAGEAMADQRALLAEIADRWYGMVTAAVRRHAPNHLVFGDKIVPHRDLPEWLVPIVGRYFDLVYLQWYEHAEAQLPRLRALHQRTGKPVLNGDSSFACPNQRVPQPKGKRVGSQREVGEAYHRYLKAVMAEPYFVGWHYCGFMEGAQDLGRFTPLITRQNGFVRPDGTVYEEAVRLVTEANRSAFEWHEQATPSSPPSRPHLECVQTVVHDHHLLTRVGERVFELRGGGQQRAQVPRKPVSWIVTPEGVIVVDTGTPSTARVALELIREQTEQPIRYIIYTHSHGTQLRGASVLKQETTEIVAHQDLVLSLDLRQSLARHFARLNSIQFDIETAAGPPAFLYPDVIYDCELTLSLGGVEVELIHVVGEADDYTVVHLPEDGVVWVADLLSGGIPMVASPMKEVRDEVRWRQALERIRSLRPSALLRTSGPPYCDPARLDEHLDVQIRFLTFLHQAVIHELDSGTPLEEAVERITLPPDLEESPFLADRYGTLEFAVRGLYHRYSGWFDRNATSLDPAPRRDRAVSFVEAMGGASRVLDLARGLHGSGRPRLALEYLDLLITAGCGAQAHTEKAAILDELAAAASNRIVANMYRRLATIERETASAINGPSATCPHGHGPR